MNTNEKRLVRMSVVGEVSNPLFGPSPYRITAETGCPYVAPGTGGVTYNVRVGDSAVDWEADHVEPGVSIKNEQKSSGAWDANAGLNTLSCVGNEAIVITGKMKGKRGTVTGKHGGVEHVLVDFDYKIMENIVPGDKILIKSYGVGLKLVDHPDTTVMNCDPRFLKKMGIKEEGRKLIVPVTHTVPAAIMGSGIGTNQCYTGDYDINLFDDEMREKYNLDTLRMGDIVAITDADHSFGRIYRKGAVSIAIVVHSRSVVAGHGPGATTLITSQSIEPVINSKANIAAILKLRKDI